MRSGAPDALTEKNERAILEAIRDGASVSVASAHAGLTRQTVNGWKRTGTKAAEKKASERTNFERKCMEFVVKLERNHADAVLAFQARITELSHSKNEAVALRAATWWLERRAKEDYAPRQEITGPEDTPANLSAADAYSVLLKLVEEQRAV